MHQRVFTLRISMTYRIKDYRDHFETKKTESYHKCKRVTFPNALDNPQRIQLIKGKDGPAYLAVWFSLVQWIVGRSWPRDGYLTDDTTATGNELDSDDLSTLLGIPAKIIQGALQRLSSPKVTWLEEIPVEVGVTDDHSRSIVVDQSSSPPLPTTPYHSTPINTIPSNTYSAEFESFWLCYPKRIGKGKAFESWKKLKPPLQTCIEQIEAMKKCEDWTKEGGKFIPLPTTWLNGRRWDDDKPKKTVHGQDPRTVRQPKHKPKELSAEEVEELRDGAATGMQDVIKNLGNSMAVKSKIGD